MTKRKKTTKKPGKRFNENNLKEQILNLLNGNVSKAYSVRQLTKSLQIRGKQHKDQMLELLFKMEEKNEVSVIRNKFKSTRKPHLFTGTVDFVNPRTAFIISDGFTKDPKVKIDDLK